MLNVDILRTFLRQISENITGTPGSRPFEAKSKYTMVSVNHNGTVFINTSIVFLIHGATSGNSFIVRPPAEFMSWHLGGHINCR